MQFGNQPMQPGRQNHQVTRWPIGFMIGVGNTGGHKDGVAGRNDNFRISKSEGQSASARCRLQDQELVVGIGESPPWL